MARILFVLYALFRTFLLCVRIFHSFRVMYGVRSTLLFDIPCKYWNWLNTLQNDKRTKISRRKRGININEMAATVERKSRKKEETLQTHINMQTNKIIPSKRGDSRSQKQILWGEKCWTIVFKEIMLQKVFRAHFPCCCCCPSFRYIHFRRRVERKKNFFSSKARDRLVCVFSLDFFFEKFR